jgi:rubrerythrin
MYKCDICGTEFDDPLRRASMEPMPDGWYEPQSTELCPICGEPYFKEVTNGE